MVRKNYPFHKRDFDKGNKLISGLLNWQMRGVLLLFWTPAPLRTAPLKKSLLLRSSPPTKRKLKPWLESTLKTKHPVWLPLWC